ncbi:hypothetical protein JQN58_00655 [Aneurinibacillus sp. BA2021]|nr:hypothetical protein [Aneurinibacillus sp. BA2021]
MSAFDRYIEKILDRVECSSHERDDMREEIRSHLEAARDSYQEQGYVEEEAVRKAITDFGMEEEIGEELQQAIFPYRNELLTTMGAGMLLYGTSGYLHGLFSYGQAHLIWIACSMFVGVTLILAALYPARAAERKVGMGSLYAFMLLCVFFGFLVLESAEAWYAKPLYALGGLLGIGALALIFLTACKDAKGQKESKREQKRRILIHLFNLISGIPVCGLGMLMVYGGLLFGGVTPFLLFPLGMMIFWAISYWAQYYMRTRSMGVSYFFGSLSLILTCSVIYMIIGKGM